MTREWIAMTREVSPRLAECELTHLERAPIDVDVARSQHAAYEALLTSLGCTVVRVSAAPDHPDSVFIEDTAVVLDEIAVIARPGSESRRDETAAVENALATRRALARIVAPGTLDGGDVTVVGRRVFVGRTGRTNDDGITQLRAGLAPFGYSVEAVEVTGCLHLKSAVTALDDTTLLVNPARVPRTAFEGMSLIDIDPAEPDAANVLRVGERLVYAEHHHRTRVLLEARGYVLHLVPASEIAKAEGAVTCCSLIFGVP